MLPGPRPFTGKEGEGEKQLPPLSPFPPFRVPEEKREGGEGHACKKPSLSSHGERGKTVLMQGGGGAECKATKVMYFMRSAAGAEETREKESAYKIHG